MADPVRILAWVGVGLVSLVVVFLMIGIIFMVAAMLIGAEPLSFYTIPDPSNCDLTRCNEWGIVKACGESYKQDGITINQWTNCMITCANSKCKPDFGILSVGGCNIWSYDTNENCYIDISEAQQGISDWETDKISLACQIDIINAWDSQEMSPACATTTVQPTTTIQHECTTANDCEGMSHIAMPGLWACENHECVWKTSTPSEPSVEGIFDQLGSILAGIGNWVTNLFNDITGSN